MAKLKGTPELQEVHIGRQFYYELLDADERPIGTFKPVLLMNETGEQLHRVYKFDLYNVYDEELIMDVYRHLDKMDSYDVVFDRSNTPIPGLYDIDKFPKQTKLDFLEVFLYIKIQSSCPGAHSIYHIEEPTIYKTLYNGQRETLNTVFDTLGPDTYKVSVVRERHQKLYAPRYCPECGVEFKGGYHPNDSE